MENFTEQNQSQGKYLRSPQKNIHIVFIEKTFIAYFQSSYIKGSFFLMSCTCLPIIALRLSISYFSVCVCGFFFLFRCPVSVPLSVSFISITVSCTFLRFPVCLRSFPLSLFVYLLSASQLYLLLRYLAKNQLFQSKKFLG